MVHSDRHRLLLHVSWEYPWLRLPPLLLSNREWGLRCLIRSFLIPYRWCVVVCLIQLPSIFMSGVSWTLWHRIVGKIAFLTRIHTILRMISTGTHNFRCRSHLYQWVHTLHCPSIIKWKLGLFFPLWVDWRRILWTWSHFIFLLISRESWSPSEPGISNIGSCIFIGFIDIQLNIVPFLHPDLFGSNGHTWPSYLKYCEAGFPLSIQVLYYTRIYQSHYS